MQIATADSDAGLLRVIICTTACEEDHLVGIRTAFSRSHRGPRLLSVTAPALLSMTTAASIMMTGSSAVMVRVYVSAGHAFRESRHENTSGTHAGVHIEAYDTHAVPYNQKHSAYFHQYSFHLSVNQ